VRRAPAVARQWHPTKNGSLRPKDFVPGSNRRVWWACPKGPDHVWQASIRNRVLERCGCPFCGGKRVSVTNSLATLFPELAAQWHPTKNAPLTPRDVRANSRIRFFWRCPAGPDHEWQAPLFYRTRLRLGCPCCGGRQLSVTNSFATQHPHVALYWHPTKNAPLMPWQLFSSDARRVWWQCDQKHEWQAQVTNRAKKRGGCPICHSLPRGSSVLRRKIREVVRLHAPPRGRPHRGP
jgi:hypothetical protein